ncbi:hypothetical protein KAI78_06370 [bacterium]|nr:hypothetical protein [bacterium]
MECDLERNLKDCNCSYSCSKKGKCCECIRYHRERGELPGCYFPDEVERTWDRSIARFVSLHK